MKDFKDWVPYLAGVASILFGVGLLWAPPPSLAADPGAVGIALSFITGGFAALGVTVGASKLKKAAHDQGFAEGQLFALGHGSGPEDGPPHHPNVGHGQIHLPTKNKGDIVVEAAKAVREWARTPGNLTGNETFEVVMAMEDPLAPSTGGSRPKGSLVIVEVLVPQCGPHTPEAHDRIIEIMNTVASDPSCELFFHKNQAQHWCCWSDH